MDKYTDKQRGSLHVGCAQLAKILNDQGIERLVVIEALEKHGIELEWDMYGVKQIYKVILKALTKDDPEPKESTEDQSTAEPSKVWGAMGKFFAIRLGVIIPPWPTKEEE